MNKELIRKSMEQALTEGLALVQDDAIWENEESLGLLKDIAVEYINATSRLNLHKTK